MEKTTDPALDPLSPGPCISLEDAGLAVEVALHAGGRLSAIRYEGVDWLVGPDQGFPGAISWGCYPMLPWAGRIRSGRFQFEARDHALPVNLGPHAIHGVAFDRPWRVLEQQRTELTLALSLEEDPRWPFGGEATHRIALSANRLRMELSFSAGQRAMPCPVLGWHPWFHKVERIAFNPSAFYPRDEQGIATLPLARPPGPLDDCYISGEAAALERAGQRLLLTASCDHWVLYDETPHATCLEPQTGPPDAFNLRSDVLLPGERVQAWFELIFS